MMNRRRWYWGDEKPGDTPRPPRPPTRHRAPCVLCQCPDAELLFNIVKCHNPKCIRHYPALTPSDWIAARVVSTWLDEHT